MRHLVVTRHSQSSPILWLPSMKALCRKACLWFLINRPPRHIQLYNSTSITARHMSITHRYMPLKDGHNPSIVPLMCSEKYFILLITLMIIFHLWTVSWNTFIFWMYRTLMTVSPRWNRTNWCRQNNTKLYGINNKYIVRITHQTYILFPFLPFT